MWVDENNFNIGELIKITLMKHLRLETEWVGNPADSTFGIHIGLFWDDCLFISNVINFLDEKSDLNL